MAIIGNIAEIISAQYLVPGVFNKFDASRAIRGPREMPRSVLLFGQVTNPLFNPAQFNKRLTVTTEAEAKGLFGEGSVLFDMWVGAKKNAGLGLPIRCVALRDDEDAIAAVYTLTIAADTNHLTGELPVYIGGERVATGVGAENAAGIAAKLHAKLIKLTDLPFTFAVNGAVITMTAKNKGELGNHIDIRTRYYASDSPIQGVSITVARTIAGALNPDLTDAITNMRTTRDTEWVVPYTDGATMTMVEEEALRRWSHEVQTDIQFIVAMRGTEAQHTAWLQPRNSPLGHSVHTTKDLTSPWVTAAMAGAVIESMASLNPCTPHTGATLVGYKGALADEGFENEQINLFMVDGGSGLVTQEDGTATLMRMVTNYTTHNTGAYDVSMRELTWIKNLSWFRWYRNVEWSIKTQGFLLGEYAEAIPGQKIMTYEVAEDMLLAIYDNAIGIARMQHRDHYQQTMVLQLDGPNGRVKVQDEPVVMNGLYQTMITSQWAAGHV
jgi:phage tail sheath gpL-like